MERIIVNDSHDCKSIQQSDCDRHLLCALSSTIKTSDCSTKHKLILIGFSCNSVDMNIK